MAKNGPHNLTPVRLEVPDNIRHNCRVKTYSDGSASALIADRAIFREPGWQLASDRAATAERSRRKWQRYEAETSAETFNVGELSEYACRRHEDAEAQRAADSLARAPRRAKTAVRDLGLSNDFRWFVTLTLDAAKVDRYDIAEITKRLNVWLDNHVRRDGLAYVLVPERHRLDETGRRAIHFHGFMNDALEAKDSGTVILAEGGKPRRPRSKAQRAEWIAAGGHPVFNLPAWDFGFTTAIELYGPRRAAVGYVCKYIGKQMQPDGAGGLRPGKIGGRWYYSGGALRRPTVSYADVSFDEFEGAAFEFVVENLGAKCRKIETEGNYAT